MDRAFEDFHAAINLVGDHRTANARKDWIVSRLGSTFTIMDSFAMGSIPKYTALADHADIDILVALHYSDHIKDRKPSTVLANVKAALGTSAGGIRRNGQAVTVRFNSWPDVDVVPASRTVSNGAVTGYSIPDMRREVWIPSRPRSHARRVADAAATNGPKFRQVIKMIKDWNRRQSVQLQSYHIEAIALRAMFTWTDYSWAAFQFFEEAQGHLDFMWYDDADAAAYLDWSRRTQVRQQLQAAAGIARSAWNLTYASNDDHQRAIAEWRRVFGQRFPTYG